MELAQCRFVTDDVAGLAGFYARLLGQPDALNEYYVEIAAGPASVGFSRRRFTEADAQAPACGQAAGPWASGRRASGRRASGRRDGIILDIAVADVDAEYPRLVALGPAWVMPPDTQPGGNRAPIFRDPARHLDNVFSRPR